MITAKFGGTAITPANLHFVKSCLGRAHNAVVVSAIGKEHPQDIKATDLLREFYITRNETLWSKLSDKYRRLVDRNSIDVDIDKLLSDARVRATRYNMAYCMSLGEELSAKVVSEYLSATYIEADRIVRFGKRNLLYNVTLKNIASALEGVELAVLGGFYGGSESSRQVFSRGGSDVSGSLCAVGTRASLYENWTDSYGVNVADPSKVFDVSTVFGMSYDEMFSLSRAGAEVLHPDAVKPCRDYGVPIKIGNFYNPSGASTLISNCRSQAKILSVAERNDNEGNAVTTILHNLDKYASASFLADFFRDNVTVGQSFGKLYASERIGVISFCCKGNTVEITTKRSIISDLYKHLKTARLID